MHSATHSVLVIFLILGGTNGDSVNQTEGPVTVSEGALMTLNCTYQATYSTVYLFWYVQHLNKAPQVLLKGLTADKKVEHEGFQATLVKSDRSFHLQKRAVQASDSAVYYCALSDTVTQGCGGAEHKPRVQMGLWLWAALRGVLFLSPVSSPRETVKALPGLLLRAKDL
uniref:Ig-like domain-containing protein n=2 Tax=Capra hircus TaxID=9925 RepID=A0A452E9G7_CAPHI